MKRIIIILISLFIMPILVNAETLTYDVCDTCEYNNLDSVRGDINSISDLSDKDIIINIQSSLLNERYPAFGDYENMIRSLTINGNNNSIDISGIYSFAKKITIDNIKMRSSSYLFSMNSDSISINNTNLFMLGLFYLDSNENTLKTKVNFDNLLNIDKESMKSIQHLYIDGGDVDFGNTNFNLEILMLNSGVYNVRNSNISLLMSAAEYDNIKTNVFDSTIDILEIPESENNNFKSETNIYNSNLEKIIAFPSRTVVTNNIYNSRFKTLNYKIIKNTSDEDLNDITKYKNSQRDKLVLNYDIYDYYLPEYNIDIKTMVYFDKEAEIKVNDRINLVDYLDYYTDDKEISYTIEDETIAKIENKELIGLKPGNTKAQVTTDDGHVVYNIDLTVYTISEKNVSMKAETKLKLNSVFKDLDISNVNDDVWEISNPKVAKIVNGEIISLSKGETDIVATINGVKYIYHLTVGDTLVSKEIKVPITGKNVKLWIVIVSILLLSVIGTCTYLLIKKK